VISASVSDERQLQVRWRCTDELRFDRESGERLAATTRSQ
jgi:hypothetical protein